MTPTLTDIFENPDCVEQLTTESIGPLLAQLAALQGQLAARLIKSHQAESENTRQAENERRLITVEAAAEMLGFKPNYLYKLTRQHDFPAIRHGKYVRVCLADIDRWIAQNRENPVDDELYSMYSSSNARKRTSSAAKANGINTGPNGGRNRSTTQHDSALRKGRVANFRARGKTGPTTREDEERKGETKD